MTGQGQARKAGGRGGDLLVYALPNLAQAMASFGAIIVFSRVLSPAEFGAYAIGLASFALLHTCFLTALEAAAFRFRPEAEAAGAGAPLMARVLGYWVLAFGAAAAICLGWAMIAPDFAKIAPAVLAAMAGMSLARLVVETRRAQLRNLAAAQISTFLALGGFAIGLALALTTPLGAAAPLHGLAIAGALAALLFGRAEIFGQSPRFANPFADPMLHYGYGLAAALALDLGLSIGDRFVIDFLRGKEAVAAYAAGYGIAHRIIDIVFIWLGMAFAPRLQAAFHRDGKVGVAAQSRWMIEAMVAIALPAAVGLAIVSPTLIGVLVGPDIAPAAQQIGPLIALAAFFQGCSVHYFSEAFQLAKRPWRRALILIAPLLVNLGLNFAWISIWGLAGAVGATLVSFVLACGLMMGFGRRLIPMALPIARLARPVAASGVMAAALLGLPVSDDLVGLSAQVLVGAVVYVAAAWGMDVMGCRRDRAGLILSLTGKAV